MSRHWKDWATKALELPGAKEDVSARAVLEHIQRTGDEPCYTLKSAVYYLEHPELGPRD